MGIIVFTGNLLGTEASMPLHAATPSTDQMVRIHHWEGRWAGYHSGSARLPAILAAHSLLDALPFPIGFAIAVDVDGAVMLAAEKYDRRLVLIFESAETVDVVETDGSTWSHLGTYSMTAQDTLPAELVRALRSFL